MHVVSKSTYYKVAICLGVLMVLTIIASKIDLEGWNVPVALAIAIAKATLIMLFFMHVRYATPLVRMFAASGFIWLAIMLVFMASDFLTRG